MTRGNQRDKAREKALKKQKPQTQTSGKTLAERRLIDATALQEKQKQKEKTEADSGGTSKNT